MSRTRWETGSTASHRLATEFTGAFVPELSMALTRFLWRDFSGRAPEPFEIVESPRLLRENMNHQETVVHQNPFTLMIAFQMLGFAPGAFELVFDFIADGLALARIAAAGDQEIVGERGLLPQVEHHQIHGLLFFRGFDGGNDIFRHGTMFHSFYFRPRYRPVFLRYSATAPGKLPSARPPVLEIVRPRALRMSVAETGSHTPEITNTEVLCKRYS